VKPFDPFVIGAARAPVVLGRAREAVVLGGARAAIVWPEPPPAPAEPFGPADLAANLKVWHEINDLSTLKSDLLGTTAAVENGPVGKILDKSGNGIHLTAVADSTRGTLRQAGGIYYVELTAAGEHGYVTPGGLSWPAACDVFMGLRNVGGTQWVSFFEAAGLGTLLGVAQSGSGAATNDNSGALTDHVDGALVAPATRDGLFDAIGDGNDRVVGFYDAALADFGTVRLFRYQGGFNFNGRFHGMIITTANAARADLTDYMMGLQGR
jgi:hypothetical protein